jgi:hypothetical protein
MNQRKDNLPCSGKRMKQDSFPFSSTCALLLQTASKHAPAKEGLVSKAA